MSLDPVVPIELKEFGLRGDMGQVGSDKPVLHQIAQKSRVERYRGEIAENRRRIVQCRGKLRRLVEQLSELGLRPRRHFYVTDTGKSVFPQIIDRRCALEQTPKLLAHAKIESPDRCDDLPAPAARHDLLDQGSKNAFAAPAACGIQGIDDQPRRLGPVPCLEGFNQTMIETELVLKTLQRFNKGSINCKFKDINSGARKSVV